MSRLVNMTITINFRINAIIKKTYEMHTKCIQNLYDLQSTYEIMKSLFDY